MALAERVFEPSVAPRIGRSVSLDHAAELLGVSRRTIYNRIRDGRLLTMRTIGGSQRVLIDSVEGEFRAAKHVPVIVRQHSRKLAATRPQRGATHGNPAPSGTVDARVLADAPFRSRRRSRSLATPAVAQRHHRARLSADLADHLAAGSPTIEVIVDGDRASVERLARRVQPRGEALADARGRRAAGERRAARGAAAGRRGRASVGRRQVPDDSAAVGPMPSPKASAPIRCGRARATCRALSGRGVTVAVIDSGIDPRHHALRSRTLATVDFTGGDGVDRFGHGTHVAAIIAGQAGRTADTRMYRGVASGAYLLNLRVLGDDGVGHGERRHRGDRLGDRSPGSSTTSASSTCRSARRCCSRIATIRCARRSSGPSAPASSSSRRRATSGRPKDGRARARRHRVAGQFAVRDDGGRARHEGHGGAGRTTRWRRSARTARRGSTWC